MLCQAKCGIFIVRLALCSFSAAGRNVGKPVLVFGGILYFVSEVTVYLQFYWGAIKAIGLIYVQASPCFNNERKDRQNKPVV